MGTREIYSVDSTRRVIVGSKTSIRRNINKFYDQAYVLLLVMLVLSIVSPTLWVMAASLLALKYGRIWKDFFSDTVFPSTVKQFMKHGADKSIEAFSIFGYEVDEDEWENHRRKLGGFQMPSELNRYGDLFERINDSKFEKPINELMQTAKTIKNSKQYKEFGLGLDTMFRHIIFSGTTGAGKTETLMSFFTDVMEAGGGVIMIDGKADQKMMQTFYRLAKNLGRETSLKIINFLKDEKQPESNTYNPILTLPPVKALDFAASLLPGGDGNGEYFKNRGIASLSPVMVTAKLRNDYYGETTSLTVLQDMMKPVNFSIYYSIAYCIVRETDEMLKKLSETDPEVERFWSKIRDKTVATDPSMGHYEKFLNYVLQISPQAKGEIEGIIGFDFMFFNQLFRKSYFSLKTYMSQIYPPWAQMSLSYARFQYHYWKDQGRNFLYNTPNPVSIEEFREAFDAFEKSGELIDEIAQRHEDELASVARSAKMAMGLPDSKGKLPNESLKQMPETPLQQHSYAEQQWTKLFNTLDQFPNVFGSSRPDVVMKHVLKNNGLLYVLLPPLSLGQETVKMIANMFVRDIQISAAEALGGDSLDLEKKQVNILRDKITPKPINVVVFDEFGAMKVPGMSVVLSQVRSINLCAILSGQDFVSFKPDEGSGEAEQKRLLANSAKYILKTYDTESMKWAEEFIGKRFVQQRKSYLDEHGELVDDIYGEIEEKEESIMDVKKLSDMMYGCGVFISGTKPVIVQSYFVGGKPEGTFITNLEAA